jgi:hypothetical protein
MPPLGTQHRNHSFPPCLRFVQKKSARYLAPPLPSVDDEPWVHFLEPVKDDEDDYADFLDFSAGILTHSEVSKKEKKPSKFRPTGSKKRNQMVVHHHGIFQRHDEPHGFVENRLDPWSHVVEHDINSSAVSAEQTVQLRPRGRSKTRTLSGHRHSWREPSIEIFTVAEEADITKDDASEEDDERKPSTGNHFIKDPVQVINDRARL